MMTLTPPSTKKTAVHLAWVSFFAACWSIPSLRGGFQSDDWVVVLESRTSSWRDWIQFFHTHWFDIPYYYRPLAQLTLALDRSLWGLNAFGYRLTNLVTYIL